jgi:hypothetical protein
MINRVIACGFLLFSPVVYGQGGPVERRASDFNSNGVGLTETLLRFSHQEHVPIAIEYVDRASINGPIDVSLRNKTVRQALDSILRNGHGYSWRLRNGTVEITNTRASKHAEGLLNRVIPVFEIPEGGTVKFASAVLWWDLQIALDPRIKGFGCDIMGRSSTLKAAALHNRTVREILSYIVLNSRAEGWMVAGPPKCLGFLPYCGLWYIVEQEPPDSSYQNVLREVRENL